MFSHYFGVGRCHLIVHNREIETIGIKKMKIISLTPFYVSVNVVVIENILCEERRNLEYIHI